MAALQEIDRENAWSDISMSVAYVRTLQAAADERAAQLAARVFDLERMVRQLSTVVDRLAIAAQAAAQRGEGGQGAALGGRGADHDA